MQDEMIGKKLRELRISRDLKQCDVADALNLSRSAVSNIENGRRSLTLNTLKHFAEFYKIDVSTITNEIQQDNRDEMIDILERTRKIFTNDSVPKEDKEDLYLCLMKMYLDTKN